MSKQITKKLSYEGLNLFIGIDTHATSWNVSIFSEQLKLKTFKQPPKVEVLLNHLNENYPGANYYSVYEAGYFGFWIDDLLNCSGVKNIVVNPSDIPTADWEKKQKRDATDSRKLAKCLRAGLLKGIYIPSKKQREDRLLLRTRVQLTKSITRVKAQIKSILYFFGIEIPKEYKRSSGWTKKFISWLKQQNFDQQSAKQAFEFQLLHLDQLQTLLKDVDMAIVVLSQTSAYSERVKLLKSIPGIGLLTSMVLLTELGDINRFRRIEELYNYLGLIPTVYASGEKEYSGNISKRSNKYIRRLIVESSWIAIRLDPALTKNYERLCTQMKSNKAIIRIARQLVSRFRYVLRHGVAYRKGIGTSK